MDQMLNLHFELNLLYILPILGALLMYLRGGLNPRSGARLSSLMIWGSFLWVAGLGLWGALSGIKLVMALLIGLISGIIHVFSIRYMAGERLYQSYFIQLALLTSCIFLLVTTDHLFVLAAAWTVSNMFLVSLILYKSEWRAARSAAAIAAVSLLAGSLALSIAVGILVAHFKTFSLSAIIFGYQSIDQNTLFFSLSLITLAALIQSAQWPFHQWLIGSLNSPTPVSAFMHAGLINGGGFLIAIFAPLYLLHDSWLLGLFLVGAVSAILGTYWQLVQPSVKRMLACSTMAQMGFMIMQCGLGFFSAAVAHLCWHGLFKGYLFLSAGSAIASHKKMDAVKPVNGFAFLVTCLVGLLGAWAFAEASQKSLSKIDTSFILIGIAFIASGQAALVILRKTLSLSSVALATIVSIAVGFIYGESILAIKKINFPYVIDVPQELTMIHIIVFLIFLGGWAIKAMDLSSSVLPRAWSNWLYVAALNSSQPQQQTLTVKRTQYTN